MKRSEINSLQREAVVFFEEQKFYLPPWAFWTLEEWKENGAKAQEVVDNKLGWDLTDFGRGDFYRFGLLLFTIRNGKIGVAGGKDYAEKIMIVREGQVTPWHFHWHKMEDIINRGGGNLLIELCNASPDEQLADTPVTVQIDGLTRTVEAGDAISLQPGESVTLPPYLYHNFYSEAGKGPVLVGEVSRVNNDEEDNRFLEAIGRFPQIEEDEPPLYPLCNEYSVA
ncbi:D-lyxose/D-mannose family sugar isomerase [bacterium]|nr:D-lyxose/D-mannose family sugar isomerase [bacterium]